MEKVKVQCYLSFYNVPDNETIPIVMIGKPIVEDGQEKIDAFAAFYLSSEVNDPDKVVIAAYPIDKPTKNFESFGEAAEYVREHTGYNIDNLVVRSKIEMLYQFMNKDEVELDFEELEEKEG